MFLPNIPASASTYRVLHDLTYDDYGIRVILIE